MGENSRFGAHKTFTYTAGGKNTAISKQLQVAYLRPQGYFRVSKVLPQEFPLSQGYRHGQAFAICVALSGPSSCSLTPAPQQRPRRRPAPGLPASARPPGAARQSRGRRVAAILQGGGGRSPTCSLRAEARGAVEDLWTGCRSPTPARRAPRVPPGNYAIAPSCPGSH